MTDRAGANPSGGVRNLLARFEAKTENTPPPSRGRSPVSSERGRSTSSRPLSKVRTSFVAVERSGQLGPILGVRKLSEGEMAPAANGLGDTKDAAARSDDGHKQSPTANGQANVEAVHATVPLPGVAEEETGNTAKEDTPLSTDSKAIEASVASPMAPKDELEGDESVNASEASPLARKSATANITENVEENGGTEEVENVGDILKGSPFESGSHSKVNGSPKKDMAVKKSPTKAASPKKSSTKGKTDSSAKPPPNDKDSASKATISRPSSISTKKDGATSSKAPLSAKSGDSKNSPKISSAPKTPSTSTSREPTAKTTSPPQPVPKSSPKANSKDRVGTSFKPSSEATKQPAKASLTNGTSSGTAKLSTSTGDPTKKPASVPSKPQPKSPTRPMRVPAAATSSTAASTAKLGGVPSRSPSRASTTTTARKAPLPKRDMPASKPRPLTNTSSTTAPIRKKVSRPSLPPQSHEPGKPRTSIAPDESFLARMMRPTAASASKVSEKVETRSPPRKTSGSYHPTSHVASHTLKPKRKSEIKGGMKEEDKDVIEDKKSGGTTAQGTTGSEGKDDHTAQPGEPSSDKAPVENHTVNGEDSHAEIQENNGDPANDPQLADPSSSSEPIAA